MTSVSSASGNSAAYLAYKKEMFSRLDTDGSGSLSKEEAAAGRPSEASAKSRSSGFDSSDSTSGTTGGSPESYLSSDVMAVLMLMKQQGGFSFEGGSGGGDASSAYLSTQMDADGDGSITQAEFVSSRPDDVSEEDATALFESIDTEGTGSLTSEQLDAGMKAAAPPPPPGGAPSGGSASETDDDVFDSLDTNMDGVVSQDEFLAYNPGASDEVAAATGTAEKSVKVDSASIKGKLLDELIERLNAARAAVQQGLSGEAQQLSTAEEQSAATSTSGAEIASA